MDDARKTTDLAEHYDYLHQAEQVLLEDAAMAPIAYYNEFWPHFLALRRKASLPHLCRFSAPDLRPEEPPGFEGFKGIR